jgi:hypothetical protein
MAHHGHASHGGHKRQGGGHYGSHQPDQGQKHDTKPKAHAHTSVEGEGKMHQPRVLRRGTTIHLKSEYGHDAMAHSSFHESNKEHGLDEGFAPTEGYKDGGHDHHLGSNVCDED